MALISSLWPLTVRSNLGSSCDLIMNNLNMRKTIKVIRKDKGLSKELNNLNRNIIYFHVFEKRKIVYSLYF
jgi:hypothetical protein